MLKTMKEGKVVGGGSVIHLRLLRLYVVISPMIWHIH